MMMKRLMISIVVLLPLAGATRADVWTTGTAGTIRKGRFEVGLFSPLRWGVSERVELSAHPLAMFVIPNGGVKLKWTKLGKAQFSSYHSIAYPSILIGLVSRAGTGGFLPADTKIPHIVSSYNAALLTWEYSPRHSATLPIRV